MLHRTQNKEAIHSIKLWNIYKHSTARTGNLQENRIWILLQRTFVVRCQSIHSCKSTIYFNLDTEIIKWNCDFVFYFNKSDITPTVLDGGNEIILANWPNDKCIICTINNNFPIAIRCHPYVLVKRSILCNCRIEAENNFLLQSLAACHDTNTKLIMYFTVNSAFTNYLNEVNLTEVPIFTSKSTSEITLPVFLSKSTFDETLLFGPTNIKGICSPVQAW